MLHARPRVRLSHLFRPPGTADVCTLSVSDPDLPSHHEVDLTETSAPETTEGAPQTTQLSLPQETARSPSSIFHSSRFPLSIIMQNNEAAESPAQPEPVGEPNQRVNKQPAYYQLQPFYAVPSWAHYRMTGHTVLVPHQYASPRLHSDTCVERLAIATNRTWAR